MEKEKKKEKKDIVSKVTFRENRKYEVKIFGELFVFMPRGYKEKGKLLDNHELTEKQINSDDFKTCKKRFIIEVVK